MKNIPFTLYISELISCHRKKACSCRCTVYVFKSILREKNIKVN